MSAFDLSLLQAGWAPYCRDLIDSLFDQDDNQHEWIEQFTNVLEIVSARPAVATLELLSKAYGEGSKVASVDVLTEVFGYILENSATDTVTGFSEVNMLLSSAQQQRLAPELLVGIARLTYRWRTRLPAWRGFTDGAVAELKTRGGFDLGALFDGIAPVPRT